MDKNYYQKHKQEMLEYSKAYKQEHKSELAEYQKIYKQTHKLEIAKYDKEYRKTHKVEIRARQIKYHQKNPLRNTWYGMRKRCYNPNCKGYKRYGGRGISVCNEWKSSFVAFREFALANGYKEGLSINRIDNDGNYEPSNCEFITNSENGRLGAIEGHRHYGHRLSK
jgi:hypothetical protein